MSRAERDAADADQDGKLDFMECSGLTTVDELGRGLSGLTSLTSCELNF